MVTLIGRDHLPITPQPLWPYLNLATGPEMACCGLSIKHCAQGAWLSELEARRPQALLPGPHGHPLLWLCQSGPIPKYPGVEPSPLRLDKKDKAVEKSGIPKEVRKRDHENTKLQERGTRCARGQRLESDWVLPTGDSRQGPWRWGHLEGRPRPSCRPGDPP